MNTFVGVERGPGSGAERAVAATERDPLTRAALFARTAMSMMPVGCHHQEEDACCHHLGAHTKSSRFLVLEK